MNKMIKVFIVLATVLFINIFINNAIAAGCTSREVNNEHEFLQAVTDNCQEIKLKNNITFITEVQISYSEDNPLIISGDPFKTLTFNYNGQSLMQHVRFTVQDAINVTSGIVALYNVSFDQNSSSVTASGGELYCVQCGTARYYVNTKAIFIGKSMKGINYPLFNIDNGGDSNKDMTITLINFTDPISGQPYFQVKQAPYLDISNNTFTLNNNPAVKVLKINGRQVVMIANNFYKAVTNGSLSLESIFEIANGTPMSDLAKPSFTYASYDNENFLVRINNRFDSNSWNFKPCPGTAHGDHVNFEPYVLKYSGDKLIGVYSTSYFGGSSEIQTIDQGNYLKIPRSTIVDNESLDGKKIAMLVHCEGIGTTVFSDPVELKICDENLVYKNGQCVASQSCVSDSDCGGGLNVCKDGFCEAMECTKNEDCAAEQECQNNACVAKSCESDSDCAENYYCDNLVKNCLSCDDVEIVKYSTLTTELECPYRSSDNENCSGCICQSGYDAVGKQCINPSTDTPCASSNEEYDPKNNKCIPKSIAVGKGGGGCSLIRR